MPAYRFCRPDDIPLLADAVNTCVHPHQLPAPEPFTVQQFKSEMRRLDLWPSSCMIALAGDKPIAVITGCKRASETNIIRIGVHPEQLRRGHGSHLVDSLSKKLAVLGPPRIRIEVAADNPCFPDFLSKNNYVREIEAADWMLREPLAPLKDSPAIGPVLLSDAESLLAKLPEETLSWVRQTKTLQNCIESVRGVGFASVDALEACIFYLERDQQIEILRFACVTEKAKRLLIPMLLRSIPNPEAKELWVPRISDAEISSELLQLAGFERGPLFVRWVTTARPG